MGERTAPWGNPAEEYLMGEETPARVTEKDLWKR
jgi:hypothetical protein